MKLFFLSLITLATLSLPFPAVALECPAGQRVYSDTSTEFPTEYCGPIENQTGVEPTKTISSRADLSASCQASSNAGNTINCSANEKAFLSSLTTPQGIGSSNECRNLGGNWNTNISGRDKCEMTPEQFQKTYGNIPVPLPSQPNQTTAAPNSFTTADPNAFCKDGVCIYTPLEPLPTAGPDAQTGRNFPALVDGIFRLLITFGGLFAVVMLVIAGIGYMVSESAVDISKAKDRAKAALWGLVLLTACWLILYTINPKLTQFDLSSIGALRGNPQTNAGPLPASTSVAPTNDQIQACENNNGRIKPNPNGGFTCI